MMDDLKNLYAKMMMKEKYLLQEKQLQSMLWEKIKNDCWNSDINSQLYLDDEKNILAIKMDNSIALLGYIHINHVFHESPILNVLLDIVTQLFCDLKKLVSSKEWKGEIQINIITTYKLSNYGELNFKILPNDANYFYVTEFTKAEAKKYEMRTDQEIINLIRE